LQASNANAGSFVGAIVGTFLDQLVNLVGAVLSESLNLLVSLLNLLFGLITLPLAIVGQLIGFLEQLIIFPISVLLLLF